jgi:uncharacterized protein YbjQ (UPF0145 family)
MTNKLNSKSKLGLVTIAILASAGTVFAQDSSVGISGSANVGTNPRPPITYDNGEEHKQGRPGFFGKLFGGERKEIREEYRDGRNEAVSELKMGMQEKRDWRNGSTTPGMATPTPWKDFRGDMRDMRQDMRAKMASITDAQMVTISAKLGITVDALKAQIASGTPLRQIIGDKISREDMMKIMPMMGMMASGTASGTMMMHDRNDRDYDQKTQKGFFNSIREKLFGPRNDDSNDMQMDTRMMMNASGTAVMHANGEPQGIRGFFKRMFGF